jgi:hypothetical protein
MGGNDIPADWLFRLHRMQVAHYESALALNRLHSVIGVAIVVLATFVGSTIFGTLRESPNLALQMVSGMFSLAAATLAGLQTFLKLTERAERHRLAGARFSGLRIELEQAIAFPSGDISDVMTNLRERWSKLTEESPHLPPRVWKRVSTRLDRLAPEASRRNVA